MSPIQIVCPVCRQPFQIDSAFAGGPAGCPHCRSAVMVPAVELFAPAPQPSAWTVAGGGASTFPGAPGYVHPQPQAGPQGYGNAGVPGSLDGYPNHAAAPLSVGGGTHPPGMGGYVPLPAGPLGLPPQEPRPAVSWNTLVFVCGVGVVGVLLVGLSVVVAVTSARKARLETARNVAPTDSSSSRPLPATPAKAVVPLAVNPQQAVQASTETAAANASLPVAGPSLEAKSGASGKGKPGATASTAVPPTLLELPDLVERVEPAVVRIETNHDSLGSGFVVREDGVVVTNFHVVEGAQECKAIFSDKRSVRVLGYLAISPERDLAVLKLEPGVYPTMPVAAERVRKGEKVAAFGAPLGLGFTTSEGNVSAIRDGKEIREAMLRRNTPEDMIFLQTTAPVSPGNSGGPLTDFRGRVVGVNTMVIMAREAQNLNFAVSAEDVHKVLDEAPTRVQSFSTMPKSSRSSRGGLADGDGGLRPRGAPQRIQLPSGRLFDPVGLFLMDQDSVVRKLRSQEMNNGLTRSISPTGKVQGLIGHERRLLQGLSYVFQDNDKLEAMLGFERGLRHGNWVVFSSAGAPALFAQYDKGQRTGFTMLIGGAQLLLLQEHERDRLLWSHVFRDGWTLHKSFDHSKNPDPNDPELELALKGLGLAENLMKLSEDKVRKWLRTAKP